MMAKIAETTEVVVVLSPRLGVHLSKMGVVCTETGCARTGYQNILRLKTIGCKSFEIRRQHKRRKRCRPRLLLSGYAVSEQAKQPIANEEDNHSWAISESPAAPNTALPPEGFSLQR